MFSKLRVNLLIFNGSLYYNYNYNINPIQYYTPHINMIKSLHIPESQLPTPQRLLQICKKSALSSGQGKPQIDFLLLDREMEQLQQVQSKTVQQIVQFVDQHLQQFIEINGKFGDIEGHVQGSEMLIKRLMPKLDMYKASLFSPQSKLQQFMTSYEKKLIQQTLAETARQQAQFLLHFIHSFEEFISLNLQQLSQPQKHSIVRMLRKKDLIRSLFQHPLIKAISHSSHDLCIMLSNVTEELEFYLSEQLSRIVVDARLRVGQKEEDGDGEMGLLEEMQLWFSCMGNQDRYFQIFEESVLCRKLAALQLMLLAHKQALIVGNEEQIVKQFFHDLFELVEQFPQDYPVERILKIIYKFLGKKELNFMYSYVVPTFPISYSAYKHAVSSIKNKSLRSELETRHGWNLKLWADLRIKTILDRSSKDKDKSLIKWLEIVFKKNFMIHGVKSYMVKLGFLLVNRACLRLEDQVLFSVKGVNQGVGVLGAIKEVVRGRLVEGFQEELEHGGSAERKIIVERIQYIVENMYASFNQSLKKWLRTNMQTIISSSKHSLQPYKSLITTILSRSPKKPPSSLPPLPLPINTQQCLLKPLHAYTKNNPELTEQSCLFLQQLVLECVQKYYDAQYARDIYNHCQSCVSVQQMRVVMEVVAVQRGGLFGVGDGEGEGEG